LRTSTITVSLLFLTLGIGAAALAPTAAASSCGESCGCSPPVPCCPANVAICQGAPVGVCALDGPACLGYLACVTVGMEHACVKDPCYHPECMGGASLAPYPVCATKTVGAWPGYATWHDCWGVTVAACTDPSWFGGHGPLGGFVCEGYTVVALP
jgi:hypothetical protein